VPSTKTVAQQPEAPAAPVPGNLNGNSPSTCGQRGEVAWHQRRITGRQADEVWQLFSFLLGRPNVRGFSHRLNSSPHFRTAARLLVVQP
jgi:hypothetical protein